MRAPEADFGTIILTTLRIGPLIDFSGGLAERRKTLESCYECTIAVISALMSAVESAVKDVSEGWNAAHGDRLISLPTELLGECFRLLDLRGRITVSHVSRRWRSSALSNPFLWDSYFSGRRISAECQLNALTTMLLRSHPLPFHFRTNYLPSEAAELISRNIDRMATLHLDYNFDQLFHLDAPMLTHLTYTRLFGPDDWTIPWNWGSHRAPRLQYLNLYNVTLPYHVMSFPALRTLVVRVPHNGCFGARMEYGFPSLATLKLNDFFGTLPAGLLGLPPSVKSVHLSGYSSSGIDYSEFVQLCKRRNIRQLDLENAASFEDALDAFVDLSSDSRSLELSYDGKEVSFRDGDDDGTNVIRWRIRHVHAIWTSHMLSPDYPGRLERFAALTLSMQELWWLHDRVRWDKRLPSLRELTPTIEGETLSRNSARGLFNDCRENRKEGAHMPALASLVLSFAPGLRGALDDLQLSEFLPDVAALVLPALLSGAPRPLASMRIRQRSLCYTPYHVTYLEPFLPLAERFVFENAMASGERNPTGAPLVFEFGKLVRWSVPEPSQ